MRNTILASFTQTIMEAGSPNVYQCEQLVSIDRCEAIALKKHNSMVRVMIVNNEARDDLTHKMTFHTPSWLNVGF